jgi:hypothetical protein
MRFYFINHCYNEDVSGNIGNKYIQYSIFKFLLGYIPEKINGISNLFYSDFLEPDTEYINNNFDFVVLNMQDQIRKNISYYDTNNTNEIFKIVNNFLSKIEIPFLVFGLGSNCFNFKNYNKIIDEISEEQKIFLKIVSNKSKLFSIRGKYTKKLLNDMNINNYVLCGCPSFYLEDKKIIKKNILKKIVLSGSLIEIYLKDPKAFILKIPNNVEVYLFTQDIYDKELIKKYENCFYSTDIEEINNFFIDKDFVIGSRVHCSIIALNNGILPVCISQDSRALEMCELFSIPHINNYNFTDIIELYQKIDENIISINYIKLKNIHLEFLKTILEN